MGRLNNLLKWILMNVNFLYSAMAVTAIVLGIFVLVSDWGSLDPGFFLGWGISVILFSVVINMITYLGCLGVSNQIKRTGLWTGRRMLAVYQLTLIGTIIAVLYVASTLLIMTRSFRATYDSLGTSSETYDFDVYESGIAKRFNEFYFSSIQTCTDSKYAFFWGFIQDHCPTEMNLINCMKCEDYSITSCPADEETCFSSSPYSIQACPYNICRGPILEYLITYFKPLSRYLLFFVIFQGVLLILNCLLICYTEQDTVEEMLVKSGTISSDRFKNQQNHHHSKHKRRPRRNSEDEKDDDGNTVNSNRHHHNHNNNNNRERNRDDQSRHSDDRSRRGDDRSRRSGDDRSRRGGNDRGRYNDDSTTLSRIV